MLEEMHCVKKCRQTEKMSECPSIPDSSNAKIIQNMFLNIGFSRHMVMHTPAQHKPSWLKEKALKLNNGAGIMSEQSHHWWFTPSPPLHHLVQDLSSSFHNPLRELYQYIPHQDHQASVCTLQPNCLTPAPSLLHVMNCVTLGIFAASQTWVSCSNFFCL